MDHPFRNLKLVGACLGSALLMVIVLNVPFLEGLFKLAQLSLAQAGIVAGLSLVPLVVVELFKLLKINTTREDA